MDVEVTIKNNIPELTEALESLIPAALEACGIYAESIAKQLCPVDTGRLRNSITHTQDGKLSEIVGTNVEYAPYVELGTSRQKAQPYLKPAIVNHTNDYKQILSRYLSGKA